MKYTAFKKHIYVIGIVITFASYSLNCFADDFVCQTRPDVVGQCQKVTGKLRLTNGTPSARIFVQNTKRILGVTPYVTDTDESFAAPAAIRQLASFDRPMAGTFTVCPLSETLPGHMQNVCIESATIQ